MTVASWIMACIKYTGQKPGTAYRKPTTIPFVIEPLASPSETRPSPLAPACLLMEALEKNAQLHIIIVETQNQPN
jgi:hypothetical protein